MSAKILVVTNQKGGVGKTTTAINVAYCLAKDKKQCVLLVDFDPQGNATSGLGVDKTALRSIENPAGIPTITDVISRTAQISEAIIKTPFKRLDLISAVQNLADAEIGLNSEPHKFKRLATVLGEISENYDYILLDSPPSLSLLTINALVAAHAVILPVQAEFFALEGLTQLLETMKLVRKGLNPTLDLLGVAVTMYDSRTTLSQEVYQEVSKHFPGKVFATKIPRNVRLAEAPSHGLPVGAYDRLSKGARSYKKLTEEILRRIG